MSTVTIKTPVKDKNMRDVIIYLIIASLGWIIPPIGAITPEGMKLLSVFLAAIVGWSLTTHVWPALLTFVLLPFTGLIDLPTLIIMGWGNDSFMFVIMSFILVAYMDYSGASGFIATWLMNRKMIIGHPWRLVFMLLFISWALGAFVNTLAGMLLTWGIIYKICHILDYKPFDEFANFLIFGVAVMGTLSTAAVPWKSIALIILSAFTQSTGIPVNMLHYLCYSLPFMLCAMLGYTALGRWVFRLDVSRLKNLNMDFLDEKDLKMTTECKIAMLGTVALIVLLILPSILPKGFIVTKLLASMGVTNKALFVFFVLSLIKVEGKPVFNFNQLATKGISWNMVLMMMSIMAFVSLLGMPETGIGAFLTQNLGPIFAKTSSIGFFVIILLVTVFLTNFMINAVVAAIMMTATLPLAVGLGVSPEQIVYLLTISCTIAFMLPSASSAAAILFANAEWVRPKDIYKYAFPTIIVFSILALVINLIVFAF